MLVNYTLQAVTAPSFPAWIQAFAALVAVGITVWLAIITRQYAKITAEALKVSREQLASQQRVYAEFGLRNAQQGGFEVWVVNLGTANFLVSEIIVRPASGSEASTRILKLNNTVLAGEAGERFVLPDQYTADESWNDTRCIDIALSCISSGEVKRTRWRIFSLLQTDGIWKVHAGFAGPLPVMCPQCGDWTDLKMRTDNVQDLDAAWARRKQTEEDLQSSHPHHKSQWLQTSRVF